MHPDGFKPDLSNGTLYFAHIGEPIGKVIESVWILLRRCREKERLVA